MNDVHNPVDATCGSLPDPEVVRAALHALLDEVAEQVAQQLLDEAAKKRKAKSSRRVS